MRQMSDVEAAWVAGVLEGEGYFGISEPGGSRAARFRVCLQMTDEDVVQRVAEYVGVGKVHAYERRAEWKTTYLWAVQSRHQVEQLLSQLMPYLGERRRARALEMLAA